MGGMGGFGIGWHISGKRLQMSIGIGRGWHSHGYLLQMSIGPTNGLNRL
jgi:hypothetical protein